MALTRANVESILVKRCGSLMSLVDMAVTVAGSNADLNDPIGYALRWAGYSVSNIASVSDTDLSSVADADYDQILDIGELRTLQNVLGNYTLVDIQNGPQSEKFSQTIQVVKDRIAALKSLADELYYSEEGSAAFSVESVRVDGYSA